MMSPTRNAVVLLVMALMAAACSSQPPSIRTLDDVRYARLGVQIGGASELTAHERFPEADFHAFDDQMDAVGALKAGHLDAVITTFTTASGVMRTNPDITTLEEYLKEEESAMAVVPGNAELLNAIDQILTELKADGTLAEMRARWLKTDLSPYEVVPIAVPTTGTPLRVGVDATREPMMFVQNGELIGHDRELMDRIGARLGRPVEITDMRIGATIPALVSGKIDVVPILLPTPERRRAVAFTQTYFLNPQIVLVRNSAGAPEEARGSFLSGVIDSFENNILREQRYLLLWDGLKGTALISLLSTLFGTALGALVCFMRMSALPALHYPARAYIALGRGIPVLVLLMLIFYVVFASVDISPLLVAVVAFGMNFAAHVSEMFRSSIEGVDRGQTEAGIAMGFTPTQTFGYVVLPQMVRRVLPVYKGEFISLVKMTSVVGYIAVQDVTKASDIIRSRTFEPFFPLVMVAVLYFVLAGVLAQGLDYLERATDPKARRAKAGMQ